MKISIKQFFEDVETANELLDKTVDMANKVYIGTNKNYLNTVAHLYETSLETLEDSDVRMTMIVALLALKGIKLEKGKQIAK